MPHSDLRVLTDSYMHDGYYIGDSTSSVDVKFLLYVRSSVCLDLDLDCIDNDNEHPAGSTLALIVGCCDRSLLDRYNQDINLLTFVKASFTIEDAGSLLLEKSITIYNPTPCTFVRSFVRCCVSYCGCVVLERAIVGCAFVHAHRSGLPARTTCRRRICVFIAGRLGFHFCFDALQTTGRGKQSFASLWRSYFCSEWWPP